MEKASAQRSFQIFLIVFLPNGCVTEFFQKEAAESDYDDREEDCGGARWKDLGDK